jgi:hypothetical protein
MKAKDAWGARKEMGEKKCVSVAEMFGWFLWGDSF